MPGGVDPALRRPASGRRRRRRRGRRCPTGPAARPGTGGRSRSSRGSRRRRRRTRGRSSTGRRGRAPGPAAEVGPPCTTTSSGGRSPSGPVDLRVGRRVDQRVRLADAGAARPRSGTSRARAGRTRPGPARGRGPAGAPRAARRRRRPAAPPARDAGPPATQTTASPGRRQRAERGVRARRARARSPSGVQDGEPVGAVAAVGEHHPAVGAAGRTGSARTPTAGRRCRCRRRATSSTSPCGRRRYSDQTSVRSPSHHSVRSAPQIGWTTDSPGPPASTCSVPSAARTTSWAASHGMSGWSHCSQDSVTPSGASRGSETKSGPLTSTSTVPSAAIRTTSLTTSAAPPGGGVGLPHGQHAVARRRAGRRTAPRRARAGSGRHRDRGVAARVDPVQPLVGEVGEPHRAPGDRPRAAAVLVHPGAGVPRRGQEVGRPSRPPRGAPAPSGRPRSAGTRPTTRRRRRRTTSPSRAAARTTSSEVIGVGQLP